MARGYPASNELSPARHCLARECGLHLSDRRNHSGLRVRPNSAQIDSDDLTLGHRSGSAGEVEDCLRTTGRENQDESAESNKSSAPHTASEKSLRIAIDVMRSTI